MEEQKKKGSNKLLIVWIIIFAIIIAIMSYYIYNIQTEKVMAENKANDLTNQITTLKESINNISSQMSSLNTAITNTTNTTITNTTSAKTSSLSTEVNSQEETVKELYLQTIKESSEANPEKLLDYRIDKVIIMTGKEREEIAKNFTNVSSTDIFAIVKYSVKPKDINNTGWTAGNGEVDGQWVTNKTSCVYLVQQNGNYIIKGDGTGW